MTVPDTLPANATKTLGSELSPYRSWQGVDPITGAWYDLTAEMAARDIDDFLRRDGRGRSVEQVLTLPLRAAPLTIKPGHGDTGEYELASESLDRMRTPLPLIVGHGAESLVYRATFLETVFTVDRGLVEYDSLAWRPPDACTLLRDPKTGRILGFRQNVPGETLPVKIPVNKAVIFLHGAHRDPVRGVSEMQVPYRCFLDKQKVRALWFIFLEGAALPRTIAHTNSGDEEKVVASLVKLKNSGVAAVPNGTTVDTLDISGKGADQFKAAIAFLDSEMAQSILAGFLDLTSAAASGTGSYALSKDSRDLFTQAQDANAREIAGTIRSQVVGPLVRLNRGPDAVVPDVQLGPISGPTVEQMLTTLEALASPDTAPPAEFVDELTIRVAGMFDLNVDKVTAAIRARSEAAAAAGPGAAGSAPISGAADVALQVATDAAVGGGPTLQALSA
jgi:hypothetical protein